MCATPATRRPSRSPAHSQPFLALQAGCQHITPAAALVSRSLASALALAALALASSRASSAALHAMHASSS